MLDEKQWLSELYNGLQTLEELSFPKKCSKCGKVYVSLSELVCQTAKLMRQSGLIVADDEDSKPVVGLYRNCTCGTTLLVLCKNRRDVSPRGLRRRETFGELLKMFNAAGVEAAAARQEMQKMMRGEESELLRQYRRSAPCSASAIRPGGK